MSVRTFGTCSEGDVLEVALAAADGSEARILTWGAILRDLRIPAGMGSPRGVVLGFEHLQPYLDQPGSLGAVVGRYANRIGGARFELDGTEVRLRANEGPNTLHGGPAGFGRRLWSLVGQTEASCDLQLVSEDGDMGFPGRLVALARYELHPPGTLRLTLEAVSDRPTPVNLTTHSYYNLDGSPDVRDHRLEVRADAFTPVNPAFLPTGEILPGAGTPFDFRQPRTLREAPGPGYDVNLVLLDPPADGSVRRAATLSSPRDGPRMELWTTEPGLQVYDGHKLAVTVPGHGGVAYGRFAGLALEPQRFPDSPNRPGFPPATLRPGQVSRQLTELRFFPDA